MRTKDITETELFNKLNLLLLDRNKEQLEMLKARASMLANVEIDNSCLLRGFIEYFYANPSKLDRTIKHVKSVKGYEVLQKFQTMLEQNASAQAIFEETGVSVEIAEKILSQKKELLVSTY